MDTWTFSSQYLYTIKLKPRESHISANYHRITDNENANAKVSIFIDGYDPNQTSELRNHNLHLEGHNILPVFFLHGTLAANIHRLTCFIFFQTHVSLSPHLPHLTSPLRPLPPFISLLHTLSCPPNPYILDIFRH